MPAPLGGGLVKAGWFRRYMVEEAPPRGDRQTADGAAAGSAWHRPHEHAAPQCRGRRHGRNAGRGSRIVFSRGLGEGGRQRRTRLAERRPADRAPRTAIGNGQAARHSSAVVTVRQGREPNASAARVSAKTSTMSAFRRFTDCQSPRDSEPRCARSGSLLKATPNQGAGPEYEH